MAEVEHLTEQEREEWIRGYPYSMAFTQGVVGRLVSAAAQVARLEGKLRAVGELQTWLDTFSDPSIRIYKVKARLDRILKGDK